MQRENLIDFAELILRSYELIRDNQQIKELYGNKFKNILIDEFQDTNEIQFKWIKNLTGKLIQQLLLLVMMINQFMDGGEQKLRT